MKPPSRISNFKTGGICMEFEENPPVCRIHYSQTVLNHNTVGKISCKAILVPKQRFMKACRNVEELKL